MEAMHGAVVNFGGQVDPQPTVQNIAAVALRRIRSEGGAGARRSRRS